MKNEPLFTWFYIKWLPQLPWLQELHCAAMSKQLQGLYSLRWRTSYHNISWSLKAARFGFRLFQSLWNFTCTSATSLPRCPSISERYDHYNIQSRDFEASRNLAVRCLIEWRPSKTMKMTWALLVRFLFKHVTYRKHICSIIGDSRTNKPSLNRFKLDNVINDLVLVSIWLGFSFKFVILSNKLINLT